MPRPRRHFLGDRSHHAQGYLPFLLILALTIYAFIDCLNTPEEEVEHLPKVAGSSSSCSSAIVGPIAWLVAGKKRHAAARAAAPPSEAPRRRAQWVAPDDNPEFLKSLKDEDKKDEDKKDQGKKDGGEDPTA